MAIPVLRASLKTLRPGASTPSSVSCHKIVLSYCDKMASSAGLRDFLTYSAAKYAQQHPSVEFVVQPAPHKQPLVRGLYINGRDKAVCVRDLKPHQVAEKVQLVLDASGRKATKIHRQFPVQSTTPSPRGILSSFYRQEAAK